MTITLDIATVRKVWREVARKRNGYKGTNRGAPILDALSDSERDILCAARAAYHQAKRIRKAQLTGVPLRQPGRPRKQPHEQETYRANHRPVEAPKQDIMIDVALCVLAHMKTNRPAMVTTILAGIIAQRNWEAAINR